MTTKVQCIVTPTDSFAPIAVFASSAEEARRRARQQVERRNLRDISEGRMAIIARAFANAKVERITRAQ